MYRVELKGKTDKITSLLKNPFLMYRVELKEVCVVFAEDLYRSRFLMYRVELKALLIS